MDACQSRNSDNPVSQTIDEILERIRLEVRCRNLKLAPDLDETNGAVTPVAFQTSESLASNIRQLVDIGRFSNVTEQVYQPTPSSTLSARGFLNLHDQHFVNFVYGSILRQVPEPPSRDPRKLRQGEDRCSTLVRLRYSLGGRTHAVKIKGLLPLLRCERSFPLCDRVEICIKLML